MISFIIERETAADEANEFERIIRELTPTSIYDDVTELQTKVAELESVINGLLSTTATNLNDKDLNECVGKIIVGYGNNCLHRPANQNGYLINIPHNSASDRFGIQIWIARPTVAVYIRNMDNGTFSEWIKLH